MFECSSHSTWTTTPRQAWPSTQPTNEAAVTAVTSGLCGAIHSINNIENELWNPHPHHQVINQSAWTTWIDDKIVFTTNNTRPEWYVQSFAQFPNGYILHGQSACCIYAYMIVLQCPHTLKPHLVPNILSTIEVTL